MWQHVAIISTESQQTVNLVKRGKTDWSADISLHFPFHSFKMYTYILRALLAANEISPRSGRICQEMFARMKALEPGLFEDACCAASEWLKMRPSKGHSLANWNSKNFIARTPGYNTINHQYTSSSTWDLWYINVHQVALLLMSLQDKYYHDIYRDLPKEPICNMGRERHH